MPRNFLLETGFLGLPDNVFGPDLPDLREIFAQAIAREKLEFSRVRCWISRYRIGILVEGLADTQADTVKEIRGPKASAAYDFNNLPSPAAVGFATAQGLELKDLVVREIDGEKYLFAVKSTPGTSIEKSLVGLKNALVAAIPFALPPWRPGSLFPQPPLCFVAMLDDKLVDLELEGVKAVAKTFQREAMLIKYHDIPAANSYSQIMTRIGLIAEQSERKKTLDAKISSILPEGYLLRADNFRLNRICLFAETSQPFLVKFSPDFLEISEAIISRFLLLHTDYLPCEDTRGKLLPAVIALTDLARPSANEISLRTAVLNERLAQLLNLWRKDLKEVSEKIGKIAGQPPVAKLLTIEQSNPLARCAVWLALKLRQTHDSAQIVNLLALLTETENTELARDLPATGFSMLMGCVGSFESFKILIPHLQEMCNYFGGRIPSPQSPLAQVISLAILMRAHAGYVGEVIVPPRRIFALLKAANIRIDIFQAFADIFPEFELDRTLWLKQITSETLKDYQVELTVASFFAAREFDPCSFYEAARDWKDLDSKDIEAVCTLYARIKSKIECIASDISSQPGCALECEINAELENLEKLDGINYAEIYRLFAKEKVNIEACLMNLPPVLDETISEQIPRIALFQRLLKQLGRLPFIRR